MDMARRTLQKTFSRRHVFGLALGGSLLLAGLSLSASAFAQDKFVLKCHAPTPTVKTSSYPGTGKIILSNNLARPVGKAMDAPGQLLYLSGRVTDENCVPVANAIIDLWQANPFGEHRWAARDELLNPEPIFAGNGRAVTDNMGNYRFVTLFPGNYGRNAPHINLRISHPEFDTLNTVMFFRGDRRNANDSRFKAFKPETQALLLGDVSMRQPINVEAGLETTFNIVLKGNLPYRGF